MSLKHSLAVTAAVFAAFFYLTAAPEIHFIAAEGVDAVVPRAITPDGSTIVGRHELTNPQGGRGAGIAFRWTLAGGIESMGTVLGGTASIANAVSADGAIVVGDGNTANFTFRVGFRRAATGAMVPVFDLASENPSPTAEVTSVSADGRVLTGFHRDNANAVRSFVWLLNGDGPGGTFFDLGTILEGTRRSNGLHFNRTNAISADGRFLAGWSDSQNTGNGQVEAFRFDRESGVAQGLGFLPGANSPRSAAHGISTDGSAVAGFSRSAAFPTGNEIFVWTAESGMIGSGRNFSSGQTTELGISGNGRFVVSSTEGRAFRWDSQTGEILFLDSVFPELAGWHYTVGTAASYDGSVITGFGYRNNTGSGTEEGWVVILADTTPPPPAPIPSLQPGLALTQVTTQGLVTLSLDFENQAFAQPFLLQTSTNLSEWTAVLSLRAKGSTIAPELALIDPSVSVHLLEFQSESGRATVQIPTQAASVFFRLSLDY